MWCKTCWYDFAKWLDDVRIYNYLMSYITTEHEPNDQKEKNCP